ncbi:class I SAM-dependent methyltransferase [Chryseolinea sp. H1M3-3]|uniref:class I SAM-dependent methyltransferase n=1 Tax=Chryseolinea sp. H1M3-3 TaxID=3034144 RepID=UPI0023EB218E|nr:class I SAM-dependent methyltransferase [Chryseolinea sp. H1M3-3]
MKKILNSVLKKYLPIYKSYENLKSQFAVWKVGLYPPGHFYSPVVSPQIVSESRFNYERPPLGIALNEERQLALLESLKIFYRADIFPTTQSSAYRYYFDNEYFSFSDGIFLYLVIRHFKPRKIIEIGSGFSSALMLDTNEKFFHNSIHLTFVEPYPELRLNKLITQEEQIFVKKDFVQHISSSVFQELSEGDILFVDSSHISKFGSDLNYLLFEILPLLKAGVIIHFHDIFYPFEYPTEWLKQGRSWNEAYLLKAFLQFNDSFEILLFTSFLEKTYKQWFEVNMPQCLTKHERIRLGDQEQLMSTTGQSIYLVKK